MAKVGAQRAAVLTGRSKSTVQRAMNSGKLSYEQDANGRRVIDVSELERVFGLKSIPQKKAAATPLELEDEISTTIAESSSPSIAAAVERERMSMQIKMLEQQLMTASEHIEDLKIQRDKWERQASQVVLTSQYSQKQAEELRTELREREERARTRRLQYEERIAQNSIEDKRFSPQNNFTRPPREEPSQRLLQPQPSISRSKEAERLDEQMKKLKAGNENTQEESGSVFRFWKKARG